MSEKWVPEDFKEILDQLKTSHSFLSTYMKKEHESISALELKRMIVNSKKLDHTLDKLSVKLKRSKSDLMKETINILDELKSDCCECIKKFCDIGMFSIFSYFATRCYVNETNINIVKEHLGKNPVIFVPSHKSMIDDAVLSFVRKNYDIDKIHIASTTEFSSNRILRVIGVSFNGFFIRRTFINDELYASVLNQYINTLLINDNSILEIFIEGTRSKTNKGLPPKYGLMKMILEPLFTGELPDITFVPVNISYDRLAEENGFISEMFGIPKESYSVLSLAKLHSINNVYFNVATPISAKEYFGLSTRRSSNTIKPLEDQGLNFEEQELVKNLSNEIVFRQKEYAFITTYNMVAFCVMMSLYEHKPLTKEKLVEKVIELTKKVRDFNGNVFDHDENNAKLRIEEALKVHKNSIVEVRDKIRLIRSASNGNFDGKKNFKGHELNPKTVVICAPVVVLQIYVNGIVPLLFPSAIICTILNKGSYNKGILWNNFKKFRHLFKFEFIINEKIMKKEFEDHLNILEQTSVVVIKDGKVILGSQKDQFHTFINLMWPFMKCFETVVDIVLTEQTIEEKQIMKEAQRVLEIEMMQENNVHPYSLTLDCILNCIKGLAAENILKREFIAKTILYHVNGKEMTEIKDWISKFSLNIKVDFTSNNDAIMWG